MTPLHDEHAVIVMIANKLWDEGERAWRTLLAQAEAEQVTLLALVYRRLRQVRDACARVAFERQTSIAEVAREWRAAGGDRRWLKWPTCDVPGIVGARSGSPAMGRKSGSS